MLRLPHGLGPLFSNWLDQHYPLKKEKIMSRVHGMRGGKMNDSRFRMRMRGEGPFADAVAQMFGVTLKKLGYPGKPALSTAAFRRPDEAPLFDTLD